MAETRATLQQQASVVRERLSGDDAIGLPEALEGSFADFSAAHDGYEAAATKTDEALALRDSALDAIGEADEELDAGIDEYANDMVAAGLGTRIRPFKGFSKHAPSRLKGLAYATEAAEVEELVKAVNATNPSETVKEAGQKLLERKSAVTEALAALTKPQAEYELALHARDLLLPGLRKAYKAFKIHAASAWSDDPATFKAVFAPPARVQNPRKRRAPSVPATAPVA